MVFYSFWCGCMQSESRVSSNEQTLTDSVHSNINMPINVAVMCGVGVGALDLEAIEIRLI